MAINLKKPNLNDIFSVPGIQLAVTEAGIKYKDKKDLALILADEGSHAAAVFTKNKFIAAPVIIAKKNLKQSSRKRACIINTGSANAGTGKNGLINAQNTCDRVASQFHIKSDEVLPFSTGVIMKHLPMEKINQGISALALKLNKATWIEVAEAIMTTDTVPKVCSKRIMLDDEEVVITGIAKGSGMIHPNMATMLAFITTNASIEHNLLTQIVSEVTEETFNLISVDGDTSTNDSFVVISTNKTKKIIVDEQDADFKKLHNIILEVARYLAHAIVRDGEGATKFIKIQVCNGQSKLDCKEIAKKIAHSPLIKTAFFASDPNLGRIMAAIGNAEVSNIDISKINIYLNDYLFAENGALATSYDEAIANKEMKKEEISLKIDLQNGNASQNFYTTDLSYDYVKINAEYRT
jgi:glutamate N-acetyltransferase / amino-acid N-acetyltransferase